MARATFKIQHAFVLLTFATSACTASLGGDTRDAGPRHDADATDANPFVDGSLDASLPFDAMPIDDASHFMDGTMGADATVEFDSGEPAPDSGIVIAPCTADVVTLGALGDGTTDDRAAFLAAFTAAGSGGMVCVPAGTYRIAGGPLPVPNGVSMRGDGMDLSWIKGRVDFGSDQLFADLKMGDVGDCALHNQDGADSVRFERCRFHGGGGYDGPHAIGEGLSGPVITIGDDGDASNIVFYDSVVERNLGTEVPEMWPAITNGCNNISITDRWSGPHVAHVTFDHCHVGASNGVAVGSPRAGLEAWCDSSSGVPDHCWQDIVIRDSVFERADMFTLDFGASTSVGGPVLVERTVIRGAGNMEIPPVFNYDICLECPGHFTIRNNIFYRSRMEAINMAYGSAENENGCDGKDLSGSVITGNQFLLDEDNGIESWDWDVFSLFGDNFEFSDNVIRVNQGPVVGGQVVGVWNAHGIDFHGNTIEDLRTGLSTLMVRAGDASGGNSFTGNTFITHSGSAPMWSDSGSSNTWTDNTLLTR